MKREMLKQELEKELESKQDVWLRLKDRESLFKDFESALDLVEAVDDDIILRLIELYRQSRIQGDTTKNSQQVILAILILGLWDDMVELLGTESIRTKLRFLDFQKFPEVYFAYLLVIKGETDPEVFGCSTNPMELLDEEIAESEEDDDFKTILKRTVREMIKEKFKRQHMYELLD